MNLRLRQTFRGSSLAFKCFTFLGVPAALFYAISSRTFDDFLSYGGRVALAMFAIPMLWLPSQRFRIAIERGRPLPALSLKNIAIFVGGAAVLAAPIGVIYYSLGVAAIDGWQALRQGDLLLQRRPVVLTIAGAAVFSVGLLFFWFRLRQRFFYGLTEAAAGVAFAVHRLSTESVIGLPSDRSFYFAMLTAGVYLVVRGLDNMQQGWMAQGDSVATIVRRLGTETYHVPEPPRRLRRADVKTARRQSASFRSGRS